LGKDIRGGPRRLAVKREYTRMKWMNWIKGFEAKAQRKGDISRISNINNFDKKGKN
jgi:hypothetical protein